MADNTVLDAGSGGDTIATDDISGVKHQRVKVQYGVDGAATDVSDSNPLPVDDAGGSLTVDNAGTFAVQVDGDALTALQLIDNLVLAEDAQHGSGDPGVQALAVRNDTLAALAGTDGDYAPLQVDANGALFVDLAASSATVTVDATGQGDVPITLGGEEVTVNLGATDNAVLDAIAASVAVMDDWDESNRAAVNLISGQAGIAAGTGAVGATVPRVTLASDDPAVALLGTIDADTGAILADTASMDTNLGTVAGAVSGGQMQVDIVADGAGLLTTSAHDAAFGTAGSADAQVRSVQGIASMTPLLVDATGQGDVPVTLDGEAVTANLGATDNAVLDSIAANTAKGASHYRNIDANAEDAIKGSAGTLHWLHAVNLTGSVAYLHLYDATTGNVTPGSTTPDYTFAIPTQGDTNGAGFTLRLEQGFANAITLVCTTTLDGSAGDPGTNGVIVNAGYS